MYRGQTQSGPGQGRCILVILGQDVGDAQAASGSQDAEALGEHGALIAGQVDHAVGDDHVDGAVRQRDRLDVAVQELDVGCSGADGVGAGEAEHFLGHVQAVCLAGRADPAGRQEHVDAAA